MNFANQIKQLSLLIVFAFCCKPVAAELILGFSDNGGGSFAGSFDVSTGGSLTIGIYLRQTAPDTVLTDEGLLSWGLDLTSPTALGSITNPVVDSAFDQQNHNVTTANGFEWEFGNSMGVGVTGDSIPLGSFEFRSTADGISLFSIKDRVIGEGFENANWFAPLDITDPFALPVVYDEQIFGVGAANTYQFSINSTAAVPEPSSFAILSCVAGAAIWHRRRKTLRSRVA